MSIRKLKILDIAIDLFNKKGCINTSTRHIAHELDISVGNLYYYFKNKEEIISLAYEEFMKFVSKQVKSVENKENVAFDFYNFMKEQMKYEMKFRFIRMEMLNICQKYPKIKEIFENGVSLKKEQFKNLFLHQIKYGFMKKLDEKELDFLVSNTWTIASQWEVYWILLKTQNEKQRIDNGLLNILFFIKPYMTQKGLKESNLIKSIDFITQGKEYD